MSGFLLGAFTSQARAGDWVVTYEYSGANSSGKLSSLGDATQGTPTNPYPVEDFGTATYSWAYGTLSDPIPNDSLRSVSRNKVTLRPAKGQSEAIIDATATVKLHWHTTTNEPVPALVKITVSASASATANGNIYATSPSQREGTGEEVEVSVSIDDYSDSGHPITNDAELQRSASLPANKSVLVLQTKGKADVDGPTISVKAKAKIGGDRTITINMGPPGMTSPGWTRTEPLVGLAEASAGFSADAQTDNRSLKIVGVDGMDGDNWRKGVGGERELNKRNADGSGIWDSLVSWHPARYEYDGAVFIPAHGDLNAQLSAIAPNFSGVYQSPAGYSTYDWDVQGSISQFQNLPLDPTRIKIEEDLGSSVDNYPHNSIVRVEVTDTKDGASAENQAVVFWHLPYEKTEAEPDKKEFTTLGMLVQPNLNDFEYDIQPQQTFDIAAGVEGIAGATGAVVGAGGGPVTAAAGASIAAGLAGLLELKWTYAGDQRVEQFSREEEWGKTLDFNGANGSVTFQDSAHMSDEAKTYLDQPNGYRRLKMGIIKVLRWNRKQWKADHFHSNGFDSSGWRLWAQKDQSVYYEPYWDVDPSYAAIYAPSPEPVSLFGFSGPMWQVVPPLDPSGGTS